MIVARVHVSSLVLAMTVLIGVFDSVDSIVVSSTGTVVGGFF